MRYKYLIRNLHDPTRVKERGKTVGKFPFTLSTTPDQDRVRVSQSISINITAGYFRRTAGMKCIVPNLDKDTKIGTIGKSITLPAFAWSHCYSVIVLDKSTLLRSSE